jgi:hypothetical protein
MKKVTWQYTTEHTTGQFESDGQTLTSLATDKRTGEVVGDLLLPYRLLSTNAWHGEAREMAHQAELIEDGIVCTWSPTIGHPARLTITTKLVGVNTLDVSVEVQAEAHFSQYEVFYSNYLRKPMRGGAYVAALPHETSPVPGWTPVFPESAAMFREIYIAFPRDERGAERICDGRWQRGRHFTRFLPCRYYAAPLAFYYHPETHLATIMMASPQDAYAVSLAYQTTEQHDGVGHHNSLYLSLFGRDLQAGEKAQARLRMVIDRNGTDPAQHYAHYKTFLGVNGCGHP